MPSHFKKSRRLSPMLSLMVSSAMVGLSLCLRSAFKPFKSFKRFKAIRGSNLLNGLDSLNFSNKSFRYLQLLPDRHRFLSVAISGAAVPDRESYRYGASELQRDGTLP